MTLPPRDQFQRLNEHFYSQQPSTYFRDRLALLGLRAVKSDDLAALIGEGVEWGNLRLGADDEGMPTPQEEDERLDRFVITESQVLLHHASEALIRMFLGHVGEPDCPWLDMAALRTPAEFRERAAELAQAKWSQSLMDDVGIVFLGGIPDETNDDWEEARDTTVRLLRILARRLGDDAGLYNSAKHGMTVIAGHGSLDLFTDDGQPVIGSNGKQVVYLDRGPFEDGEATWFQKTQWLNPQQAVFLTALATTLMEGLWTVARWRYLDEPWVGVKTLTPHALEAATRGFEKPGPITHWSQSVATERRKPKR